MIKIDTLKIGDTFFHAHIIKIGDTFFHAHINKVYECIVTKEVYTTQDLLQRNPLYEVIRVDIVSDLDSIFTRKDEKNLFFSKEDANVRRDELIKNHYEYLRKDGWIEELWHLYNATHAEMQYKVMLRKVIEEKTGYVDITK